MSKDENVKIETVWSNPTIKGQEKIETIYPKTVELPNYDYWQSQNTIDASIWLRNVWKYCTWILANIATNWDIEVTWVRFIPKLIKFTAIYSNWTSSAMSIWSYYNKINNCVVLYDQSAGYSENSRCFRLWAVDWLWRVTATNRNGFTLNVLNAGLINYTVIYECFG